MSDLSIMFTETLAQFMKSMKLEMLLPAERCDIIYYCYTALSCNINSPLNTVYEERLSTYRWASENVKAIATILADCGLYHKYINYHEHGVCFSCGKIIYTRGEPDNFILKTHMELSPQCPYILLLGVIFHFYKKSLGLSKFNIVEFLIDNAAFFSSVVLKDHLSVIHTIGNANYNTPTELTENLLKTLEMMGYQHHNYLPHVLCSYAFSLWSKSTEHHKINGVKYCEFLKNTEHMDIYMHYIGCLNLNFTVTGIQIPVPRWITLIKDNIDLFKNI
jgi:hypothetical protein